MQEVETVIFYSSVESSQCAANWKTRFSKLTLKWNKLVDLRNLYPNMVVFGLELFICWSWFRIWTWKYWFPKFSNIYYFFVNPHRAFEPHLHECGGVATEQTIMISSFLTSKSYQNIDFDQIKNRDINLMIRSWNGDFFLLSSIESSHAPRTATLTFES